MVGSVVLEFLWTTMTLRRKFLTSSIPEGSELKRLKCFEGRKWNG